MDFEGWRAQAYDDPAGFCTIGFGHLIAKQACKTVSLESFAGGLTRSMGEQLLDSDMSSTRRSVAAVVKHQINAEQYSALYSFAFNVGKRNFEKSTLLKFVNEGKHQFAAVEFQRWIKAGGVVYRGLQDRRSCESQLFVGKLVAEKHLPFKRASCVSTAAGAAPSLDLLYDIDIGESI
ncbi:hypothetical protein GCM10007242_42440 [Pigmentiphaga litoralis]|nr:hypothetical protein GCM10007242_42440 [Pigmentiphaga litoralis]